MSHIYPLIRPVITDSDPGTLHSVWFLLDEVNGTYNSKSGVVAKSKYVVSFSCVKAVEHR